MPTAVENYIFNELPRRVVIDSSIATGSSFTESWVLVATGVGTQAIPTDPTTLGFEPTVTPPGVVDPEIKFWNGNKDWVEISAAAIGAIPTSEKGVALGVATLDADGFVELSQMNPAVIERVVVVADEAARYALTTAQVQNGDVVNQQSPLPGTMWYVVDDTNLDNSAGYLPFSAGVASSVTWSGITGKPAIIGDLEDIALAEEGDVIQYVAGEWVNVDPATLKTSLSISISDVDSLQGELDSKQTQSAVLDNMSAISTSGIVVRTVVGGDFIGRELVGINGIEVAEADGNGDNPTISLTETGVTAGTYGNEYEHPVVEINSYGRVVSVTEASSSNKEVVYILDQPTTQLRGNTRHIFGGGVVTYSSNILLELPENVPGGTWVKILCAQNFSEASGTIGISATNPTTVQGTSLFDYTAFFKLYPFTVIDLVYSSSTNNWTLTTNATSFLSSLYVARQGATDGVSNSHAIISNATSPRSLNIPDRDVDLGKVAQAASGTLDGYLASADWNTFNGKQAALGDVITANTYGSSTQYPIVTVNANGIVTGVTLQTIAAAAAEIEAATLNYKNLSEASKIAAEAARDIAQLSSGIYTNTTLGLAATTDGQYFSVPQSAPSDIMFDLYKNNAGVALYVNSYSSSSLVKYSAHSSYQYAFVDADGFIIAYIDNGAIKTVTNTVSTGLLDAGTFSMQYLTDATAESLTLRDPDGFIFATLSAIGKLKSTAFELDSGLLDAGTFIMQYLSDATAESLTLRDPDGFIFATLSALGKLKSTTFELDSGLLDTTLWSIRYNTVRDGYLLVDQDGFILMSIDATDGIQAVGLESSGAVSALSHAKRIAVFGDSRTEQNSLETSNNTVRLKRLSDYGYLAWAHYFTSGNIELVCNAGIGGNTTSQMLSRFNTAVLPYAPDELWGEAGINDYAMTEEDTISNLTGIFDLCDENGIYIRWCTISPLASAHATFSAANVARICNINKWLREQALTRKNFTLIDSFSAMIDRASTNGIPKSGMMQTDDSIHQSPKGAMAQGYAYAQSFIKDNQILDYLPQFAGQRYSLSSAFKQIFNNPLFTDTGGTNSTSGVVTGTIPANCTISKTGTWGAGLVTSALVARADGFGYDWVLTVTNAGAENDELSIITEDLSSSISNSDVLYAAAEVSMSGLLKNRGFYLEIRSTVNSAFSNVSTLEYGAYQPVATDPWTDDMYSQENSVGVLRTPNLTIGATGTISSVYARFKFRFGGVGSTAVIKIGRMAIFKN